jgi:lantibiotic biosynthesis protein
MDIPYRFQGELVLRLPHKATSLNIKNTFLLENLYFDKTFLEALYLASPVLYTALLKYKDGKFTDKKDVQKLRLSLAKYYLRMCNRCTPFGLFSGCATTSWKPVPTSVNINMHYRHTRFDMHYLCALAQHLASLSFIKDRLLYYPNSSFYNLGKEIRYVDYKYINTRRHHLISAVAASNYITTILELASNGIKMNAIIQFLVNDEIEISEAISFVNEIIDSQLLVNQLEPAITGNEFLFQILDTLNKINNPFCSEISNIISLLETIIKELNVIDKSVENNEVVYQKIITLIKQFDIPFEESKLFQTDLSFTLKDDNVNSNIQDEIVETLDVINKLNKSQENQNLQSFIKRFYERFEDNEMPLLEVLDTETGIGYAETNNSNILPLVDDMVVQGKLQSESKITWSKKDKFLLKKLNTALVENKYEVNIDAAELADFKNDWNALPPSMVVMFRLLDDEQIFVESAGGSSAANLLSRFAHGNTSIKNIVNEIVAVEDELNPDIIFAEIVHLPESRIGNILLHPAFRKYEIPFLAKSSVADEYQISLQDLYISVKNNVLIIRSKKLNKQIIPRLSTAHNFSNRALPIYQFLCDLQLQGKQAGIYFNWGVLEGMYKFLPRLTHKKCIVYPATWHFDKKDIEPLLNKIDTLLTDAIAIFKKEWKLPSLIVLADNDNELLINLEDELMIEIWLDTVKSRTSFVIKEFLCSTKDAVVKDKNGKVFCNQFVATLLKKTTTYISLPSAPIHQKKAVQQNFSIGSEWLYFKLYCGVKSADVILANAILPLVNTLLSQRNISTFFFIRYNDPHFHLRLRFKVTDVEDIGEVIKLFYYYTSLYETDNTIWKIQMQTYKRELERYGNTSISFAEDLFHYDSIAVLELLQLYDGDEREAIRWQWAIKGIDDLLNDFNISTSKKFTILEQIKNSFLAEYNADKFLKDQLTEKYRMHRKLIEDLIENKNMAESINPTAINLFLKKSSKIKIIVNDLETLSKNNLLEISISTLLISYIHMLVNRIVSANPRLHELVIYDMLCTYYRSCLAKEKYNNIINVKKRE